MSGVIPASLTESNPQDTSLLQAIWEVACGRPLQPAKAGFAHRYIDQRHCQKAHQLVVREKIAGMSWRFYAPYCVI
jgi:hypothetical protein